jgi:hypothetical protein
MNFHLVGIALWVMPVYCINPRATIQDIVWGKVL